MSSSSEGWDEVLTPRSPLAIPRLLAREMGRDLLASRELPWHPLVRNLRSSLIGRGHLLVSTPSETVRSYNPEYLPHQQRQFTFDQFRETLAKADMHLGKRFTQNRAENEPACTKNEVQRDVLTRRSGT